MLPPLLIRFAGRHCPSLPAKAEARIVQGRSTLPLFSRFSTLLLLSSAYNMPLSACKDTFFSRNRKEMRRFFSLFYIFHIQYNYSAGIFLNTKTQRNKAFFAYGRYNEQQGCFFTKPTKFSPCKPLWRLLSCLLSLYQNKTFVSLCLCV